MHRFAKIAALFLWMSSSLALAQNSLIFRAKSSKPGEITLSGGVLFKKQDIRVEKSATQLVRSTLEVERVMAGLGIAFGVGKRVDLYGFGAYHFKSELEGIADDDSGFVAGLGVKLLLYRFTEAGIYSFVDLNYTSETYASDLKANFIDTRAGIMGRIRVIESLNLMGGIEFAPYFSGKGNFGGIEEKLEAKGRFAILAGILLPFASSRAEASFWNGSSFTAAADFKIKE